MHVVDLAELSGFSDPAAAERGHTDDIEFDDPRAFPRTWGMLLLLAVRDRAASVHYHPWREYGSLAYIVDNVRYEMVPPPFELAGRMIDTARAIFIPAAPGGGWFRRSGPPGPACAAVELDLWGNRYLWDAVIWSSGPRAGVELFRIAPPVPLAPPPDGEPVSSG